MRNIFKEITLPIALVVIVLLLVGAWLVTNVPPWAAPYFENTSSTVYVDSVPVRVMIASTTEARTRGLSNMSSIPKDAGLLMIFDYEDYYGIWMKEMNFPIDVIWISDDMKVVDIVHDMRPDTYPTIFEPKEKARFVLETNAIFAASFSLEVGDDVVIPEWMLPEDLKNR